MADVLELYQFFRREITPSSILSALRMGMLSKSDLKDNVVYAGFCRNATCAKWDEKRELFWYYRRGEPETVPYASDWDGYDLFVPVGEANVYDAVLNFY